jgi:hypothetical protein
MESAGARVARTWPESQRRVKLTPRARLWMVVGSSVRSCVSTWSLLVVLAQVNLCVSVLRIADQLIQQMTPCSRRYRDENWKKANMQHPRSNADQRNKHTNNTMFFDEPTSYLVLAWTTLSFERVC